MPITPKTKFPKNRRTTPVQLKNHGNNANAAMTWQTRNPQVSKYFILTAFFGCASETLLMTASFCSHETAVILLLQLSSGREPDGNRRIMAAKLCPDIHRRDEPAATSTYR